MERRTRAVLATGLAALLTACATYKAEPLSPANSAAALDARTLDDPRLETFLEAAGLVRGKPQRVWTLETLTFAALYLHPDLPLADARLAVAQAAIRTAAQRPNPTLNITPQYNATTLTPSPWTVGAAVNILLETFGKRPIRIRQARELAEAARFDLGTTAWQVRGRVRAAMIDLWATRQRVEISGRRLDLQTQLVGFLERREAVGEASGLDVAREGVNRDQFSLALQDARRDVADARAMLATAVGVPVRALDEVALDLNAVATAAAPADTSERELRRRALTGRTDIQSSLSQYAAAQSALRLQIVSQYPNLTLGPGYQYDQGDNKFSLAATVDLPILNQNQGPIAEAAARRRQARASFTALQAQVIGQIDRGWTAYRSTSQSLAAADALIAQQRGRQARTADLFRAGQIDHVTLLAGDLELAATELGRLQALISQRQALGQIEDALQQPVFAPAVSIPSTVSSRIDVEPVR